MFGDPKMLIAKKYITKRTEDSVQSKYVNCKLQRLPTCHIDKLYTLKGESYKYTTKLVNRLVLQK